MTRNGREARRAVRQAEWNLCTALDEVDLAYKAVWDLLGVSEPEVIASGDVDLSARIKALEDKLNAIGDDSQLANVDLQNELQKQQAILQAMSLISKIVYDTAIGVIRKLGE